MRGSPGFQAHVELPQLDLHLDLDDEFILMIPPPHFLHTPDVGIYPRPDLIAFGDKILHGGRGSNAKSFDSFGEFSHRV